MTTAKKTPALMLRALVLFGLTDTAVDIKKVSGILYALGLRSACGRCGGSGSFSWCQTHGSTCFGCGGKGEMGAKLTKETLALATAKVEAGELIALRAAYAEKKAAKKKIAPMVEAAKAVYMVIGEAYTVASTAARSREETHAFVESPLFHAQTMNNAIFYDPKGIFHIGSDVKQGARRDYDVAVAEIEELTALLVTLRDAWLAFDAAR